MVTTYVSYKYSMFKRYVQFSLGNDVKVVGANLDNFLLKNSLKWLPILKQSISKHSTEFYILG